MNSKKSLSSGNTNTGVRAIADEFNVNQPTRRQYRHK